MLRRFMMFVLIGIFRFAWAESPGYDCSYVVGNGNYYHYGSYRSFEDHVKFFKHRWSDVCRTNTTLMSGGPGDSFTVSDSNSYELIPAQIKVDYAATKKNVKKVIEQSTSEKVYMLLDDHGGTNGTGLFDGELTPDELRPVLKKSGKDYRIFFNHCYAGKMLSALYDDKSGEIYGCGVAISADEAGLEPKLDNFDQGDMNKLTTIGPNKVTPGQDFELNSQIITSDYFLLNYKSDDRRKTTEGTTDCPNCLKQISDANRILIKSEIQGLKKRLEIFASARNSSTGLDTPGSYFKDYAELASKYNSLANTVFKEHLHKNHADLIKEFAETGTAYEKCIADGANQCDSEKYNKIVVKYEKLRKDFLSSHRVSEIPDSEAPRNEQYRKMTFSSFLKKLDEWEMEARVRTQLTRREDMIKKKIAALESIDSGNDVKAFKLWQELSQCESSSQL